MQDGVVYANGEALGCGPPGGPQSLAVCVCDPLLWAPASLRPSLCSDVIYKWFLWSIGVGLCPVAKIIVCLRKDPTRGVFFVYDVMCVCQNWVGLSY